MCKRELQEIAASNIVLQSERVPIAYLSVKHLQEAEASGQ